MTSATLQGRGNLPGKIFQRLIPAGSALIQNALLYMLVLVGALALKHHYSVADAGSLGWILRPTAFMVQMATGREFEADPLRGFIHRPGRLVIAPSCAGVNFLIMAGCMISFVGIHRAPGMRRKLLWCVGGFCAAYVLTLLVNTARIAVSINLYEAEFYSGFITQERVHRVAGAAVYFTALRLSYGLLQQIFCEPGHSLKRFFASSIIPMFWYWLVVFGIPLVRGAYGRAPLQVAEHWASAASVVLLVAVLTGMWGLCWHRIRVKVE